MQFSINQTEGFLSIFVQKYFNFHYKFLKLGKVDDYFMNNLVNWENVFSGRLYEQVILTEKNLATNKCKTRLLQWVQIFAPNFYFNKLLRGSI